MALRILADGFELVIGHRLLGDAQAVGDLLVRPAADEQQLGAFQPVPLALSAPMFDLLGQRGHQGVFFQVAAFAAAGDAAGRPARPKRLPIAAVAECREPSGNVGRRPSRRK